jgi:NAD(P)-dependent dehydrogenase (short-subunit alcohol dehydrogenase family)
MKEYAIFLNSHPGYYLNQEMIRSEGGENGNTRIGQQPGGLGPGVWLHEYCLIITPPAHDELKGPRGAGYRRMIELCSAGRAGTPDEVGNVAAFLMGPDGALITGSDFLMDGGLTAAYWFGELTPK